MTEGAVEQIYKGTPVTGGIAIGPLHVLDRGVVEGTPKVSFDDAIARAIKDIETLIEQADETAAGILEFQLALLDDDDLLEPVRTGIEDGRRVDRVWRDVMNREIEEYSQGEDETFAARADDLRDLRDRVLRALFDQGDEGVTVPNGAIIFSYNLTPSAFLGLDWNRLAGAVLIGGSTASHVSILARARGVPLMVATNASEPASFNGDAVLDLREGCLIVKPDVNRLIQARKDLAAERMSARALADIASLPAVTRDGTPVQVLTNIDDPSLLSSLSVDDCDGIGLTRTEFLFHDGAPDEETQLNFYRSLVEWANGRPVTVRTLDAGGDKPIPGITLENESNPFLGARGVRLSLKQDALFRVQLRALARAAAVGAVKVMVPMVTVPDELDTVRAMFAQEVAALEAQGVPCALPAIGMMVEVPAAALDAGSFNADFYSIGTNDLIQYTTASARDNSDVNELADPENPAVLRLLKLTVKAGEQRGVPVSICGDMASSPDRIETLLRLGIRALSCAPAQIGLVKRAISEVELKTEAETRDAQQ